MFKALTGILKPNHGKVNLGGIDVRDIKRFGPDSIYSVVAVTAQNQVFTQRRTLYENIILWNPSPPSKDAVVKLLKEVGLNKLTDKMNEKVNGLSGGEKVRLGIVRAVIRKPKVLILDEPTSSLDKASADSVRNFLWQLHKQGMTIICSTHDRKLADEIMGHKNNGNKFQVVHINKGKSKPINDMGMLEGLI